MHIRDRVVELRRVPTGQLRPNPRNWRVHPPAQREALRGLLAEIGFAGALLARQLPDGTLELIDGHLRAETMPGGEAPVLVLDVDEAEAAKLLAAYDPVSALAEADRSRLDALLDELKTNSPALQALFDNLREELDGARSQEQEPPAVSLPEAFQLLVECGSEAAQHRLYDELTARGLHCRVLTL